MGLAASCSEAVVALSVGQVLGAVVVLLLILVLAVVLAHEEGGYRARAKVFAQARENAIDTRWLLPVEPIEDDE